MMLSAFISAAYNQVHNQVHLIICSRYKSRQHFQDKNIEGGGVRLKYFIMEANTESDVGSYFSAKVG